jgi:hypothetical protein
VKPACACWLSSDTIAVLQLASLATVENISCATGNAPHLTKGCLVQKSMVSNKT